jgi:hypothetical protein
MDVGKLCVFLDRKFKKTLPPLHYQKVMEKINKIIGVIYGSVTGLLVGATTQPLGPHSAARAFDEKMPFTMISEKNALADPILGQILIQLTEFKNAKWDSEKYKQLRNYLSVVINSSMIKVDLQPQFVEQIRMNKTADLYSLFSEDFYTRVPLCALFGDATLTTVIQKIMQTHTSFEASAYGIVAASIIQMILQKDDLFELEQKINWDLTITDRIIPVMTKYYEQFCAAYFNQDPTLSEAEQIRISTKKTQAENGYKDIIQRLKMLASIYDHPDELKENIDHLTEEQREDYKITSIYESTLDKLKLHEKHSSHPAMIAVWIVRTIQAINHKINLDAIDPSHLIRLILRSIAVRTGCSAYNCMIAGAVLGGIFGFTQIPEEFYDGMDPRLMERINKDIWEIISVM